LVGCSRAPDCAPLPKNQPTGASMDRLAGSVPEHTQSQAVELDVCGPLRRTFRRRISPGPTRLAIVRVPPPGIHAGPTTCRNREGLPRLDAARHSGTARWSRGDRPRCPRACRPRNPVGAPRESPIGVLVVVQDPNAVFRVDAQRIAERNRLVADLSAGERCHQRGREVAEGGRRESGRKSCRGRGVDSPSKYIRTARIPSRRGAASRSDR